MLELSYAIVFPSHLRLEAGISLLEGAMYGKPMTSSEIGTGTSYINSHGETGLVVPPSDPPALRQAMRTLWANPQQAAVMGVKAEARYRQLFSAEEMGRQWAVLVRGSAGREVTGPTPERRQRKASAASRRTTCSTCSVHSRSASGRPPPRPSR